MSLKSDVDAKRREISSDNLSMSIGELLNLYKDKELDIHPEFQRVFRWESQQKSRLIESLLLGIPLPSIYVATSDAGVWEVIDGVQRLSTIFEFMGELLGPNDDAKLELQCKPALVLEGTKHLPSLEGATFETMDHALRLEFKRTRLDIKVLAREQQGKATGKFDLFERLNTYGEPLSPQELRNCVLVSLNPGLFRWLKELASDAHFRASVLLSEAQVLEQYDMDLALRFVTLRDVDPTSIGDVHEFLRDRMEQIATDPEFDTESEREVFQEVFAFLDATLDGDAFRRWNEGRDSFSGGFSLGAYEGLALSLGRRWQEVRAHHDTFDIRTVVKSLWSTKAYQESFSGLRARERMARVRPAADALIADELARCAPRRRSAPMAQAAAKVVPTSKAAAKRVAVPRRP
ncbi:DUF262 domain-containing protein [Rhizobacter sp. SG703]|uniref:DUF262 domain-containing protein n=1 Tax=Rhizobacter sp. SG703 TaxID=2587140 RepID=UPI00144805CC|nr:DUF262 domain-containing protein [Rhizobacter sp. SG703]NKI95462.1 hypothetical protein [Rhizobacter sp. SG703]